MPESRKTKRFVWVLSLTLGPIVYGILLLTLPGTPNIEAVKKNLIELVVTITVYWAVGLGLVWAVYWLGKIAVEKFFGDSPLPRASRKTSHYESITGADTLALALAELHLATLAITAVRPPVNTIDC